MTVLWICLTSLTFLMSSVGVCSYLCWRFVGLMVQNTQLSLCISYSVGCLDIQEESRLTPLTFWTGMIIVSSACMGPVMLYFVNYSRREWALQKKSAQVIQASDEDVLWTSGVLNTNTPLGLRRAVFFYMGKVCCLRGGEEQNYHS